MAVVITAQGQHSLSGSIRNAETKAPIAGVEIFHQESQRIIATTTDGSYLLSDLSSGENHLVIFANSYEVLQERVVVDGDMEMDFVLEQLRQELSDIQIAAKRTELFAIRKLRDIEGTSIFAGKRSEVVVMDLVSGNLANNNSRQVYAQVAGLNIYEGNDGGLQLNIGGRGLDPNRTSNFNTRQNGYDISADVLGYPENYYTPPAEAILEIKILRGASSLQYGTQFGGLIDFQIRKVPTFKPIGITTRHTLASFGTYNNFTSIGINKGKFSINGFYNYKNGDGYRDNSAYTSHNGFLSVDYRHSDKTSLSIEGTLFNYLAEQAGGLTDQQFVETPRLSTRDRNWFQVDWKLLNVKLQHEFSPLTKLSVSLFGLDAERNSVGFRGNPLELNVNPITSLDEQDSDGNFILPRDLILGGFNNVGGEVRLLHNYILKNKKAVFLIGGKYYNSSNTAIQGPGSTLTDADFSLFTEQFPDYPSQSDFDLPNLNVSLFAENIIYLSDKLSLVPGLRLEYIKTGSEGNFNSVNFDIAGNPILNEALEDNRTIDRYFPLFGLGLTYKLKPTIEFIANVSQNYRSVTFSDIRVVNPTFVVDPDIADETGITTDIGIRGRLGKVLSFDVTAYSIFYNDRIGIILNDRANRERKNIGDAIIVGAESLLNVNVSRWLSPSERNYTLSAFLNTAITFSEYLSSEDNNVVGNQVEFIPRLNLKTGIDVGYKNLKATLQYTYLSDQFTDAQNSLIAPGGDLRSGIVGEIPAYGIADVTINYSWKSLSLETGINNVFDTDYFTRRATGYPGPGIIPSDGRSFFVTVGYRY